LEHHKYPGSEEAEHVIKLANTINSLAKQESKLSVEQLDDSIVTKAASFATSSLVPQCAFFGGIIAQEIVKFTGKYSPLKQWLHYDIFETLPEGPVDRTPMNCRYDD